MNEASSIFVDKIAIEKLKTEKLGRVSNALTVSLFNDLTDPEEHVNNMLSQSSEACCFEQIGLHTYRFISPVKTPYPENNYAIYHIFRAQTQTIGCIIFVHGLFDDNKINYNFLFSGLNKSGFDVYLLLLPYHYERKPASSFFGGEYFWSADIRRTKWALLQSVEDLLILYRHVSISTYLPVYLAGFSMGGGVVLNAEPFCRETKGIFLMNSVSSIARLPWESDLLESVRTELINNHMDIGDVVNQLEYFDPLRRPHTSSGKTMVVYGAYDQVIQKRFYQELLDKIKPAKYIQYKSGHLNMLRVPRLASDITGFFESLT